MPHLWTTAATRVALCWGLVLVVAACAPPATTPKTRTTATPAEVSADPGNLSADVMIVCPTPAPYPPGQPYPAPNTSVAAATASSPCRPDSLPQAYPTVISDGPAPNLGVVIDKNTNVLSVDAYSVAERAGVRAGDVLVWIEDLPFAGNREQVKALIAGAQPGQALRLRVLRAGQTLDLQVVPAPVPPPIYPTIEPGRPLPTYTPVPPIYDYL